MLTSWIGSPCWRRASLSADRVLTSLRSCVVKQMDPKRASSAQGCGAQPSYQTRCDAESGVPNSQRSHVERSAILQHGSTLHSDHVLGAANRTPAQLGRLRFRRGVEQIPSRGPRFTR
ncbi:hypothetical protein R1flu_012469 [Riccia fluitans]|uniref:Uncharacterized protein n=1 Tax=Riccia fluitans TaxID=41844 RepID=A0ABD1ZEU2_9MARC